MMASAATGPRKVSMPSIYDAIDKTFNGLTLAAAIVLAYLILDWWNDDGDDPESFA